MQTATFIVVLVILVLTVYHGAKIKEMISRLDELIIIMNRIYNLIKP